MLVCPQCQTLNPQFSQYCSECRTRLVVKSSVWFAIIAPIEAHPLSLSPYLDTEKRYRTLNGGRSNDFGEIETRVWDLAPKQAPYCTDGTGSTIVPSVPPVARPYLHPHVLANSALPQLRDTWATETYTVLLLKDRTDLSCTPKAWGNASTLQQLYWMYQTIDLWSILTAISCRASLTDLHNLHLDTDRIICLQRLYPDPPDRSASLRDLGQTWKTLFQTTQTPLPADVAQFVEQVATDTFSITEDVRSNIERFIDEREADEEPTAWDFLEREDDATVTEPIPPVVHLSHAGQTDIGRQRSHNEDTFTIWTQQNWRETPLDRAVSSRGLYVLCDGMGGHEGGEIASALAADTLIRQLSQNWGDELPEEDEIRESVRLANQAIYTLNQQQRRQGSARMGTTLVMLLVDGDRAAVAHVGDSRLYRITASRGLQQLTTDHEVGQHAIRQGVDPSVAYSRPEAYQLTQALGPRNQTAVRPDIQFVSLTEDTLFLLASDGLTDNNLVEAYWETHLQPFLRESSDLETATRQLIELANRHNGRDNITAVLVRVNLKMQAW